MHIYFLCRKMTDQKMKLIDMADKIGVSNSYLSRILSRHQAPSPDVLFEICNVLNLTEKEEDYISFSVCREILKEKMRMVCNKYDLKIDAFWGSLKKERSELLR